MNRVKNQTHTSGIAQVVNDKRSMLQVMDQILQSSSSPHITKESLLNPAKVKKSSSQLLKVTENNNLARAKSSSMMQKPYENSSQMRRSMVMFSST